eukprot:2865015-Prorocentrum_lima.AAC.1
MERLQLMTLRLLEEATEEWTRSQILLVPSQKLPFPEWAKDTRQISTNLETMVELTNWSANGFKMVLQCKNDGVRQAAMDKLRTVVQTQGLRLM